MHHTILVVDDDKLILNALKEKFSGWDFEVYTARSSEEAREILARLAPEVILLDVLLTTEQGSQEILDYLKSQTRLADVPVLVFTNLDNPEIKQKMLQQGVKEYLTKANLSLDDLYEKIMGYLMPEGDK